MILSKDFRAIAQLLRVAVCTALIGCFIGCGRQAPSVESPPLAGKPAASTSKIPTYDLRVADKNWMSNEGAVWSRDTHPAGFSFEGRDYGTVKLRYRGAWARTWPKKPLKVFFNEDNLFQDRRCLNLNSEWRDPAFVREPVAYAIYAACGVPAPKAQMVRVRMNGEFYGLFAEIEQPDKKFLKRVNLKGTVLFKTISRSNQSDERDLGSDASFARSYERETNKEQGVHELQVFCHGLARATNVLEFFTLNVDLEKYINYLAATALVQHWDSFNKNHYMAYDAQGSKKWFVVPWDLDRTLGDMWDWTFDQAELPLFMGSSDAPGITGWNRMANRFFSDPVLRKRFLDRLQQLLDAEFTTAKLFPLLDQLEGGIATDAAEDRRRWPSQTNDLHAGIDGVKKYIERRRAFLLKEIARYRK